MEIVEKGMKIIDKIILEELLEKMIFHSQKIVHLAGVRESQTFGLNGALV